MDRNSDKIEETTVEAVSSAVTDPEHDEEFSPEEQKRIIRRIDRRLVVTLGVLYCVSLMDRTNLGAAVIAGMGTELMLIGDRYVSVPNSRKAIPNADWADAIDKSLVASNQSIITLVFFITYILFQPPSTVIVRALGPRVHLALITLLWGSCMIGMGFAADWEQMAGLRVILGFLEAGFFPSCVYLLSTWYTRCT